MLVIRNITKKYRKGAEIFTALDDVSFRVEKGDFVAVTGPSGSGKSTLLHSAGGLIHPDSGRITFNEKDIYSFNSREADHYRRSHVGFVFQQFHLMPYLTVLENIRMACYDTKQCSKIDQYLGNCLMSEHKNKYPSELSVGEKQRAAFIRAIITDPDILLADEPTGNLDSANSSVIMELIEEFHRKGGTVLLVSHDREASEYAQKRIILNKGKLDLN